MEVSDPLIIDKLMNTEGLSITQLFDKECGSPLYPPTSFHVSTHFILFYCININFFSSILFLL